MHDYFGIRKVIKGFEKRNLVDFRLKLSLQYLKVVSNFKRKNTVPKIFIQNVKAFITIANFVIVNFKYN